MDQIKIEFSKNINTLQQWYQLFASFEDNEMSSIRREIILENLTYQMIWEEAQYKEEIQKYKKKVN